VPATAWNPTRAEAVPSVTGGKILLVVEDDDLTREMLTLLLEGEGYTVEPACDGRDALQRLRHDPRPDCILLDLAMPRMDGRQFRAWQQQVPGLASVPVVVVSAEPRAAEEAALLGAEDYLRKPVSTEELLAAVRRHCSS
jgi:CheY-like chemotaxis protein